MLLIALAVSGTAAASGTGAWRSAGMYATPTSGTAQVMPMVDSTMDVSVRGPFVETTVAQTFSNKGDRPTEATYIFPLPSDAAVTAMEIQVGTTTIVAAIEGREQAAQRYEAAVRAGVMAATTEMERNDVFTQTIASVPAKGTVKVVLRYESLARFADGTWTLAVPLVVAPRFVPGTASGRGNSGSGRSPDTDRAPDASRVTPGASPGGGGATTIALSFGVDVEGVTCATHELKKTGDAYSLTDAKTDHDAVIRWRTARPSRGWGEPGFAAVLVQAESAKSARKTLRAVLVLDHAAAMKGDASAAAMPFVRAWLADLKPADRVRVGQSWLAPTDAATAVEQLRTQGAFDLTKILTTSKTDGAPILLVSSGLVADDQAAIRAAKKLGVPIHVIGVGASPARGVLERIAAVSGGTVRFVLPADEMVPLAAAVATDLANGAQAVAINWGSLKVEEVVPAQQPRLGAGQAMIVAAKVAKSVSAGAVASANVRVRGELFALETLPTKGAAVTTAGPLARRWARMKLDDLLVEPRDIPAIATFAQTYGLVSPYTSLVAIGKDVVVKGGVKQSVSVPVAVPAGMRWEEVKQETTVDLSATEAPEVAGEVANNDPNTRKDKEKGVADEDGKPAKKEKPAKSDEADEDGASSTGDAEESERYDAKANGMTAPDAREMAEVAPTSMQIISGGSGRLFRVSLFAGGGIAHAGENRGLFVGGLRFDMGVGRVLAGIEGSLVVIGGDAQGRVLATESLPTRFLIEPSLGVGVQFGSATGLAWNLGLRIHMPRELRAVRPLSIFVRYDGARLDGTTLTAGSAGLEWAF
jgi:Ca-activated chloride channel family protein